MSKPRAYSNATLDIMRRFFVAFDECRYKGLISSVTDFCRDNEIDKSHFYVQRKNLGRGFFEVGWLVPIVECGVSPSWLLRGQGQMFE